MLIAPVPQIKEIVAEAQSFWANEDVSIDQAIVMGNVPFPLRRLSADEPEVTAVRMFIAKHVADTMTSEPVSKMAMKSRLESDSCWKRLCQIVKPLYPTEKWIENIAPLLGGSNIIMKWPRLHEYDRFPLIPTVAKAIALGRVRCSRGTDHFTFVSPLDQETVFRKYCLEIGNYSAGD